MMATFDKELLVRLHPNSEAARALKGADEDANSLSADCHYCVVAEGSHGDSRLCTLCQHSRINHLLRCLESRSSWPKIKLGSLKDIKDRENCSFCKAVWQAAFFTLTARGTPFDFNSGLTASLDLTRFTPSEGHLIEAGFFVVWTYFHGRGDVDPISAPLLVRVHSKSSAGEDISPALQSHLLGNYVDWSKIKDWFAHCLQNHAHGKDLKSPGRQPAGFRLVDIHKQCIVPAPPGSQYIALSYVWGDRGQDVAEASKSMIDTLKQPGSFSRIRMPATIQDAITLCSHLDIQYLWVDRLCILQDDKTHKHNQITAMDQIYSSAILTICAAAGDDANAGLLGLEVSPRHFKQRQYFTDALEIIPMLPAYEHFKLTKWASRGWTYQEHLLSKRILLFTPWQIFFHCSKGALAEGLSDRWMPLMDQEDEGPSSSHSPDEHADEQPDADSDNRFASYMEHVENYNHRSLTYPSDVHNAFAGIYKSLYRTLDSSLASLPAPHLDRALLWTHAASAPASARRIATTTTTNPLPSWSWTHLSTRVTYRTPPSSSLLDRSLLFGSLVAWYRATGPSTTPVLLPPSPSLAAWTPPPDPSTLPSLLSAWPNRLRRTGILSGFSPALSRLYVDAAAALGCVEGALQEEEARPRSRSGAAAAAARLRRGRTWAAVQRASVRRYGGGHAEWWRDAVMPGAWRAMGGGGEAVLGAGRLGCRAGVLWVGVEEMAGEGERWEDVLLLRDGEGRAVGTVAVPRGREGSAVLGGEAQVFAVMALSVTDADGGLLDRLFEADPGLGAVELDRDGERTEASPDVTVHDSEGVPLVPPPALNVMMLGWRGEVAHRIAIGKVLLTRWAEAGPEFRNIILE